jgi:membrane-bound ClpP family serine protease
MMFRSCWCTFADKDWILIVKERCMTLRGTTLLVGVASLLVGLVIPVGDKKAAHVANENFSTPGRE